MHHPAPGFPQHSRQAKIKELSRELRHLQRHLSKRETEVLNLTQELHDREGLGPVVDARTLKSVCPRPHLPPGCSRHRLSVRKQPVWRHWLGRDYGGLHTSDSTCAATGLLETPLDIHVPYLFSQVLKETHAD
jgi:hypothetical protein